METPVPGVDVNPLTQALQRRLQQRSVLYLMGPAGCSTACGRCRGCWRGLPRTAWDLYAIRAGLVAAARRTAAGSAGESRLSAVLADQFGSCRAGSKM